MPLPHRLFIFRLLLLAIAALFATSGAANANVAFNPQEQALANLMVNASDQNRPFMMADPILSRVARARAADMARRDYFGHVNPDGEAANYLVTQAGYQLPDQYPTSKSSNNIESIAAGYDSASKNWDGWLNSSSHRTHVLATNSFYQAQTSYGVGYVYAADSTYKHYWVVITAPPSIGGTIDVVAPVSGTSVAVPQVALSGKSSGSPAASAIQYRIENASGNSSYRALAGTTSWSGVAGDLAPGANTIRIRSLDGSGAVLAEATRTVRYLVMRPLTVTASAGGTVTSSFLGTTAREVGRTYTITAIPAAGYLFQGWSGSVSSTKATLTFTMREGFTLTANFSPNPFLGTQGAYLGLVHTAGWELASSGQLKVKVNASGAFTGKLVMGGSSHALKGRLSADGRATVSLPRDGKSPLNLTLQLDLSGSQGITGSVSDGSFTAAVSAARAQQDASTTGLAGRYTVSLPATTQNSGAGLQGHGYATLVVSSTGQTKLVGSLAEGSGFTSGGVISQSGIVPLYVPLYAGKGALAGELSFRPTSATDCDGQMHWSRLAGSTGGAVALQTPMIGSRYSAPAQGAPVVQVPQTQNNATLFVGDATINPPVAQPATLSDGNRVLLPQPLLDGLAVTINTDTGRFSGSFVHPISGKPSRFRGIIFQKQNAGFGFFLGAGNSGFTSFIPAN